MSREAPYNRLKRICRHWIADKVLCRHRKIMWILDFDRQTYPLKELKHKIQSANDLGYTIELSLNDSGNVVFSYVKELPNELPFELKY